MTCVCGHVRHINGRGLCLAAGCFCLIYRPRTDDRTKAGLRLPTLGEQAGRTGPLNKRQQPTDPGVVTRAGGEALPQQGQSEGTP